MKIKKLFTLLLVVLISLALAGCKDETETTTDYVQPSITSGDTVVFNSSYNSHAYEVTKKEINTMVRYYGGIGLLLQEIDKELLSSYVENITTLSPEYISRYNRLVYSTDDEDTIAALSDEEKATDLQEYNYTMYIMGLDTEAKQEEYIKLLAARDVYTEEYINDCQNDEDSDYYVSEDTLESYYTDSYWADTKAIVISFSSMNDYRSAVKSLGLVIYNSELRVYTGSEDINNVAQRELNDENTREFNDNAEALSYFIQLYNIVYSSYKEEATAANVYTSDDFNYNFIKLSTVSEDLASYMFSMSADDYTYTVAPYTVGYGTAYTIIYKLTGEDKADYADATDEVKNEILSHFIDAYVATTSVVTAAMANLRSENGITFNDRYFAADYVSYDSSYDDSSIAGDSTILVKLNDFSITADDFYNYATERDLAYYLMYAAVLKIEETMDAYTLLYGDERDVTKNASLRYISYYDDLESYISSNYSADDYELESDYIFDTFGFNNFEDALNYYYVSNDLKTMVVYSLLFNIDDDNNVSVNPLYEAKLQSIMDDYYNNYYDLYTYELSIYTDYDGDFEKDDLEQVIDNIDEYGIKLYDGSDNLITDKAALQAAYEAELDSFYELIKDKVEDADSASDAATIIKDFIDEYNNSSRIDGDYSEYKELGFMLSYSAVSTTDDDSNTVSITYYNYGDTATAQMNAAYLSVYDKVISDTYDDVFAIADSLTIDEVGAHFILATEGDGGTTKPSFKYSEDEDEDSEYNNAANNDSDTPTMTQFINAMYIEFYEVILTDSDTALSDFNISYFPDLFPSDVDFSDYVTAADNYFYSESFVNIFFAGVLSQEEGYEDYATYQTIYQYFLDANN
ncbi:MAG: hypothetical protein H6687_03020 [Bacillales bacterium]|nr:hypothetical protein [Bacillales bacterium]